VTNKFSIFGGRRDVIGNAKRLFFFFFFLGGKRVNNGSSTTFDFDGTRNENEKAIGSRAHSTAAARSFVAVVVVLVSFFFF
jgi:hypothetical protein